SCFFRCNSSRCCSVAVTTAWAHSVKRRRRPNALMRSTTNASAYPVNAKRPNNKMREWSVIRFSSGVNVRDFVETYADPNHFEGGLDRAGLHAWVHLPAGLWLRSHVTMQWLVRRKY